MAVAGLAAGSIIGQVVMVASSPILTRLYDPSAFGRLTVFSSLVMIAAAVMSGKYELAIPLPADERDARALVWLCIIIICVLGTIGTLLSAQWGGVAAAIAGDPKLESFMFLVPPVASIICLYAALSQLNVRIGRFGAIATRNVLQGTGTAAGQISAAPLVGGSLGLILGMAFGHLLGALSLLRSLEVSNVSTDMLGRIRRTAKTYWKFPALLAPTGLLNVLGVQLPPLVMARFYGAEEAGLFGLAQRVLWLPVLVIGMGVAQVYLNEAAKRAREAPTSLLPLFDSASKKLALVGLTFSIPLLVAGPSLFGVVFGDEWTMSGNYSRVMSLALLAHVVAFPLSHTLIVMGRPGLQALWDIARLVLIILAMFVPVQLGFPSLATVTCLSGATAVSYLALWLICRHALRAAGAQSSI